MTSRLRKLRAFLKPYWKAREEEVGRIPDMGDTESAFQCDFTSAFIGHVYGGRLRGGYSWKNGHRQRGGLDGELHYWRELEDGTIVDLTADQFGYPEVVVLKPQDSRRASFINSFSDSHLKRVERAYAEQCKTMLAAWNQLYSGVRLCASCGEMSLDFGNRPINTPPIARNAACSKLFPVPSLYPGREAPLPGDTQAH